MRVVFLSIVLSALALSFDAHALTTGVLYKHCNKYAERSFEYSEPTDAIRFNNGYFFCENRF